MEHSVGFFFWRKVMRFCCHVYITQWKIYVEPLHLFNMDPTGRNKHWGWNLLEAAAAAGPQDRQMLLIPTCFTTWCSATGMARQGEGEEVIATSYSTYRKRKQGEKTETLCSVRSTASLQEWFFSLTFQYKLNVCRILLTTGFSNTFNKNNKSKQHPGLNNKLWHEKRCKLF